MTDSDSTETGTINISRRKTLKVMGAGTGGAALIGVGSLGYRNILGTQAPEVWPQHQYDAANTGIAPNTGPRYDVAVKWQYKTRGVFTAGPVVADGMVYACNWENKTYAWDAETGDLQWTFPRGNYRQMPAVFDDTLYFADIGGLYAVDAKTGELRWKNQGRGGYSSSGSTIADGILYYAPPLEEDSTSKSTIAVDPETGEELWTAPHGEFYPTVKDGKVFGVGYTDDPDDPNSHFALDAETGEVLWTHDHHDGYAPPVVVDGTVYIGGDQNIYSFDAETGEKAFDGKYLYTDDEPGDGLGTGDALNQVAVSPVVADGVLYSGSTESVFAIDAETGEVIWKYTNGEVGFGGTTGDPALVDGILYIGDKNGRMYGFNAETGEPRFSTRIVDGPLNTSPAVVNGNIFVCASYPEKTIFALKDPTTT